MTEKEQTMGEVFESYESVVESAAKLLHSSTPMDKEGRIRMLNIVVDMLEALKQVTKSGNPEDSLAKFIAKRMLRNEGLR